MFELGLRQAFDKPVVIIQDENTPQIFDISMLRYTGYRSSRLYHEVLEDQDKISEAIKATMDEYKKGGSTNSLIKLLEIEKAVIDSKPSENPEAAMFSLMQNQIEVIYKQISRISERISEQQYIEAPRRVQLGAGLTPAQLQAERESRAASARRNRLKEQDEINVINMLKTSRPKEVAMHLQSLSTTAREVLELSLGFLSSDVSLNDDQIAERLGISVPEVRVFRRGALREIANMLES